MPTTYVRDRVPDAPPRGRHRCSNEPGIGKRHAPLRSSQGGHKKKPRNLCCVTTRPNQNRNLRRAWKHTKTDSCGSPLRGAERAVDVRRRHGLGEHQSVYAAPLVAWRPASAARASGISDLGNTVGSSVPPGRCGHTLFADRRESQATDIWRKRTGREYVEDVPREVLTPEGAARETPLESLGHFLFD